MSADSCQEHFADNSSFVIEPHELHTCVEEAGTDDSSLRVLDLRAPSEYTDGHVPSALSFPINLIQDPESDRGALLPLEEIALRLGSVGVSDNHMLVLYDDSGLVPSAKLYWVLNLLGHTTARLLNGGFIGWSRAGLPKQTAPNTYSSCLFTVSSNRTAIADKNDVLSAIADKEVKIVDARSADEFAGRMPNAARNGHIPGAVNINWENHIKDLFDPSLKPTEELRKLYTEAGLTPDSEVIVYCRSGSRSSHSYFVLKMLGYKRVRNYAGSWLEWGNDPDTPIEQ